MKIVIDANVFISAFIKKRPNKPYSVIERAAKGLDTLFVTGDIVAEFKRVIRRPKFDLPDADKEAAINVILSNGKTVAVLPKHRAVGACRDPKDDMYLECALAAHADYVVTGDNDLLVMAEYGGVKMVSPSAYLDLCGPDTR